ncbi:DUF3995 domain-containing protein [Nocardiopsis xinjiangensis]|uniref:DUF3995 domain-containing protein n=1 Tax=Nocardiopsis xinjiangensis TaxID=124285 RepID=UPI000A018A42|nr:DUF3995 domain-containing protein [Nocardiopsis xinjiangensis]
MPKKAVVGRGGGLRPLEAVVSPSWPAYAAAVWAFLFGLLSLYWAVGGTWLSATIGEAVTAPALKGDPLVVAAVWASALGKFAVAVSALALVQRWGQAFPRWFLLSGGGLAAGLLVLYGGAGILQQVLMAVGLVDVSDTFAPVLYWHLFLWSPYWLLGGVFFALAAVQLARCTRR